MKLKNFIFINRKVIKKSILILRKNDVIEIFYNKSYLIYLNKITKYFNLYLKKKNLSIYKNDKYKLIDIFNKSLYFENSYKTNTIIFLNNRIFFFYSSNILSFFLNYYLLKMYFWKI